MKPQIRTNSQTSRRGFLGGSDARIIMGNDEQALVRLWREKRGEIEPEDLSGNLIVQLGIATEDLNRRWYEATTGQVITDVQRRIRHPVKPRLEAVRIVDMTSSNAWDARGCQRGDRPLHPGQAFKVWRHQL
jgi:predicted phage-related endonuclease